MAGIVIVEDDGFLREELMLTFRKAGYPVAGMDSFAAPEAEILALEPELLVLDINLPGTSGLALCRWFKANSGAPVLILTARDTMDDELTALGLGADDFLTKPCHPDRILARAAGLLKRYGRIRGIISAGGLSMDTDTYKVIWKDGWLVLPETEGRILRLLMERYPEVVPRQRIFETIWGTELYIDENILQVNLTRLRKRLAGLGLDGVIRTLRGQGYRLEVEEA